MNLAEHGLRPKNLPPRRVQLGRIHCDFIDRRGAVARIQEMVGDESPRLVVTPNIAHVWQAEQEPALRDAYGLADLATPDGWPVVLALKWLSRGRDGIERVTGADLLPLLAELPLTVSLVGGRDNAAILARDAMRSGPHPDRDVWVEPVPPGELSDPDRREALIDRIVAQRADLIFIGLGVPKQEELALDLVQRLDRGVVLCVGAAIDFMAGVVGRAPRWMQILRIEWLHRLMSDPKRMWHRYTRSAPHFVRVVLRERRLARATSGV